MRPSKIELCATLLLVCGLITIQAQEAVVASGGNVTGSGTVSYSIGQVVYTGGTVLDFFTKYYIP